MWLTQKETSAARGLTDLFCTQVSKVQSEKLFADGAEASGGKWDSITLNPSDNLGPILSPHQKDMGPWQHK